MSSDGANEQETNDVSRTRRWANMRQRTRLVLCAAAALVIGFGATAAYAYFAKSGNGTAAANVGSTQPITVVTATGTVSTKLQPSSSADLLVQVNNPNGFSVTLTGVSQFGSTVTVTGGSGCTSSNAGVTIPTQTGLNITIASGTNILLHVPNGAAMSAASASGCQGASFQIPVALTVQQG